MNKITHEGELDIMGLKIPCYILEEGTRVLSGRGMQEVLKLVPDSDKSKERRAGDNLARFIANKWFNELILRENDLAIFRPLICYKGNQKINGYEAIALVDFCNIILKARKDGKVLTSRRIEVAEQCELLVRAFAKVGIIALVDEATGYQYEREKDELQKILKAYIAPELLPWQKKFPDEFYKEIFRLNKWDYTVSGIQQRPGVIGNWTKLYIYKQLPKGVLEQLIINTPKTSNGKLAKRLHQSLTLDIGNPHLEKQLVSVITLMNISRSWGEFKRFFSRKYGQQELNFEDGDN